MTTTITHDPDDPRGCIECPLFAGVPRDGVCRGLGGMTLNFAGRFGEGPLCFEPDPDCPLRNGGVNVRGPEIPADHHEPARGDAVREAYGEGYSRGHECAVASLVHVLNGEPRGTAEAGEAAYALDRVAALLSNWRSAIKQRDEAMDTVASIATALGMDPGALDGAVVERVETLVRDLAFAVGGGTFSEAFDLLHAEALDGEGVVDTARRLIRGRDEAVTEGERRIDAALDAARQAREERDAQRVEVERLTRERDEAVAHCEKWSAVTAKVERMLDLTRLYLARAIRGCDFKERRAIEADLRFEGVTPPGVLVSAEDAADLADLRALAEAVRLDMETRGSHLRGDLPMYRALIALDRRRAEMTAAGRPLASEEA